MSEEGPERRRALEDLKIAVLANGVRSDAETLAAISGERALTTHEYPTTGGVACRIGHVYLNAPFDEWFVRDAETTLALDDEGRAVLVHGGLAHVIDEVFAVPSYVGRSDRHGPLDEVVFSHLDRVRLSPLGGCAHDCAFCDLPGRIDLRSLERLRDAGDLALDDTSLPIRHLLISGGSPGPAHREAFAETVVDLVRHFSARVEVDVMISSGPGTATLVERLVEAGVHGLSLNIELYSAPSSEVHIRSKHRRARPHLEATITRAVGLLGRTGRVRSLILPGLERTEDTLEGVAYLAELGADPVLSPFRPARGTALASRDPVDPSELREVLDRSRSIAHRHGVRLGPRCLPCQHNTLSFPWDVDDVA